MNKAFFKGHFLEQLLYLMNQIGASVKAGDFSTQLANNIFLLCQQLKYHGQHMEHSHKGSGKIVCGNLKCLKVDIPPTGSSINSTVPEKS